MQELYLIRTTACHKPWRYSGTVYTTNEHLFNFLKNSDESYLPDISWSEYEVIDEDTFDPYEKLDEDSVEPVYPFIVLGEVEIYTE